VKYLYFDHYSSQKVQKSVGEGGGGRSGPSPPPLVSYANT